MNLKTTVSCLLLTCCTFLQAQLSDDFSDGDFTNGTVWSGNTSAFTITTGVLNSNNDPDNGGLDSYYLSVPSTAAYDASWEFYIDFQFATSGANYVDVFLMSDQEDLSSSSINGYFVRCGGTDDELVLYKITNGTREAIIDFGDDLFDSSSSNVFKIRVTRDVTDLWTLEYDDGNTGTFSTGGSTTDGTFDQSTHFGLFVVQSGLNGAVNGHFFDDFVVTGSVVPDTNPPTIIAVSPISQTQVEIDFSEDLDQSSAETLSNYSVNGEGVIAAVLDASDKSKVLLAVNSLVNGGNYVLTVNNVEDLNGNAIVADSEASFDYIVYSLAEERDIVINEFIVDPDAVTAIPNAEYIELYNTTDKFFDLAGFIISEQSPTSTSVSQAFSTFTLRPSQYVILCTPGNVSLFESYGNVLGVSSLPDLNQTNITLALINGSDDTIDQVSYAEAPLDGVSFEQINPLLPCNGIFNFGASVSEFGGTPGTQNSVFSDEPDVEAPQIVSVAITSQAFTIVFSEPLEESTVNLGSFEISENTVASVTSTNLSEYEVALSSSLVSEAFHEIVFTGIEDCSGNDLEDESYTFYYDITPPQFADLVILSNSEIGIKFNEPLRESVAEKESNFLLSGAEPSSAILQDSAVNRVHLTFEAFFVEPSSYMISFENLEDTSGNVSSLQEVVFAYSNEVDSAYVIASNLLALKFETKPSIASATNIDNYLLNGDLKPNAIAIDESDSTLIRLSFGQNFDGNRSMLLYIENIRNKETNELLVTPAARFLYDTQAPNIDRVAVDSENQISLFWEEPINEEIATSASRYRLEDGENPTEVEVLSDSIVQLRFAHAFEIEQEKTVFASGIPDIHDNVFASSRRAIFVYDPKPPVLEEVIRSGEKTVRLSFHEKLDTATVFDLTNFEFEGASPIKAKIIGPDSLMIFLDFNSINDSEKESLTFRSLADSRGNVANDSTVDLNTENPNIVQMTALSDSILKLTFSEEMGASFEELVNYQNSVFDIVSLTKENETDVLLELDGNLKNEDKVNIAFSNLIDASGNALQQAIKELTFLTLFESYRFINDKTLELVFETEFESISKDQFLLNGEKPQLAVLDGDNTSTIRLVFAADVADNTVFSLTWNDLIDLYGRRLPDYRADVINDGAAPELVEVESDLFGVLNLSFNEGLEEESAESKNLFSIVGFGNPTITSFDGDSTVTLDFNNQFVEDQQYDLVIDNLSDLSGNFLKADTTTFSYNPPAIPEPGDVLITEYMADPTPVVGLPDTEYIELYNVSNKSVNLKSLGLLDGQSTIPLSNYELGAGEYVLLVSNSGFSLFDIPNKLAVAEFPNLLNTVGGVGLVSIKGDVIDLTIYSSDWYGDTEKDDGGYSLELINPESKCFGRANWTASNSENGGTPGSQNSVYSLMPDLQAPIITSYDIESDNSVIIHFSEPMDSLSIANGSFSSPALEVSSVDVQGIYFESVEVQFEENLTSGQIYSLAIEEATDCSGNAIVSTVIRFGLGRKPSFNEILITEIMSDPDPVVKDLPNSEYLEIYNASEDLLSLDGLILTDGSDTTSLSSQMLEPGDYLILCPTSSVSDFEVLGASMGVSNWPSLANSGEQLSLWIEDQLVFSVEYDQDWHNDLKASGGFSLELKDLTNPCGGQIAWGSATDTNGGTPGKSNSNMESVPDSFGPSLVSAFVVAENQVRLDFSESLNLDAESAQFQINPPLDIEGISLDQLIRSSLTIDFSELLAINQIYEVTVSNIFDCKGNEIENGVGTFVRPGNADSLSIIINEVLFNPKTGGVDFVEIYNNSDDFIDLKNWFLVREQDATLDQLREISNAETILAPREYLAFTTNAATLYFQYPLSSVDNFLEMPSFPTYGNDEGTVVIMETNQNVIDKFTYLDDYHSSLLEDVDGVSLERIDFDAATQSSSNWTSASSTVGFATPGYANSQSFDAPQISGSLEIDPKVFVPGSTSLANQSFTTINYQFEQSGKFANVIVYDQYGRPVQELANGASLSTSGFMKWDGTDSSGNAVRSGYYLVVFEVFDSSGRKDVMKETVVVGWE
ncbi:MAG: lamin tail domain-containing protein [Cyclobacteriaceae bacterium]